MLLEVRDDVAVGELAHLRRQRIRLGLKHEQREREHQDLRYNRLGSSTSRSSWSSIALGGSSRASCGRARNGHPTPAWTSAGSTPGYSAASTSSPVLASRSRTPLSVITLATRSPGLVRKSTRSGNA